MELEDLPNIKLETKDFLAYRRKMPPNSANAIEGTINECGKYVELFQSEIGQILIKDMMPFISERIKMVCNGKATDTHKIELNIMLTLCDRWNHILKTYNQKCLDIKKVSEREK